jgi:hypothetical protein
VKGPLPPPPPGGGALGGSPWVLVVSRCPLAFRGGRALLVRGGCHVLSGVAFSGGVPWCCRALVGGLVAFGGRVGALGGRLSVAGALVFPLVLRRRGSGGVCVGFPRAGFRGGLVGLGGCRLCGAAAPVSALGAGVGGLRAGAVGGALMAGVVASLPPALAGAAGGVVAVAGSRSLPSGGAQLVASVAHSLVAAGASLVVGCAVGADAAVVTAVPPAVLQVLAAFGPGGAGAWSGSAVSAVWAFAATGGAVVWWAGGGPAVPLRARLAARTRAVVAKASAGLVVFFGSPASRGSVLAAQLAAARGLPVVTFPLGFAPAQLPLRGCGFWTPAGGSGVWAAAWVWVPSLTHGALF